jgi:hypothetical protein
LAEATGEEMNKSKRHTPSVIPTGKPAKPLGFYAQIALCSLLRTTVDLLEMAGEDELAAEAAAIHQRVAAMPHAPEPPPPTP